MSKAFSSNNTAGNLIVVYAGWGTNTDTASISDTAGNLYATAVRTVSNSTAQIWYAKNIRGGPNTVTVTLTSSQNNAMAIHEYSGMDTVSPLDVTATSSGNSTTPTSTPTTTNYANELIFGTATCFNTCSNGSTFTARELPNGDATEDKITSVAGSYSATFTQDVAGPWNVAMAAFKATQGIGQTLMSNTGTVTNSTGRVKYRLSAGAGQPAGTYTTVITYTILGTF